MAVINQDRADRDSATYLMRYINASVCSETLRTELPS